MSDVYLVGYDGTKAARRAIDFAAARANQSGGSLHIVNILEWSPYAFYTPEELAARKKERNAELKRARALVDPIQAELSGRGLTVTVDVQHGHPADRLCQIASEIDATQIVIGRSGDSVLTQRLLGSLAISLAQVAPVPLTIVP